MPVVLPWALLSQCWSCFCLLPMHGHCLKSHSPVLKYWLGFIYLQSHIMLIPAPNFLVSPNSGFHVPKLIYFSVWPPPCQRSHRADITNSSINIYWASTKCSVIGFSRLWPAVTTVSHSLIVLSMKLPFEILAALFSGTCLSRKGLPSSWAPPCLTNLPHFSRHSIYEGWVTRDRMSLRKHIGAADENEPYEEGTWCERQAFPLAGMMMTGEVRKGEEVLV